MWFNSQYDLQKVWEKYDKAKKKGKLPSQLEETLMSSMSCTSGNANDSNSTY